MYLSLPAQNLKLVIKKLLLQESANLFVSLSTGRLKHLPKMFHLEHERFIIHGQNCRFLDEALQIGAAESDRVLRQIGSVYGWIDGFGF